MDKQNCWELKGCGREPGGVKAHELGVCAAAVDDAVDGINSGKNGGRICWAVTGTLCGGKVQGSFAEKRLSCMTCEVFAQIKEEEGLDEFKLMIPGQVYIPQPAGQNLEMLQEEVETAAAEEEERDIPEDEYLARAMARAYWRGVADAYSAVNGSKKGNEKMWIVNQTEKWWPKYLKKAQECLEHLSGNA